MIRIIQEQAIMSVPNLRVANREAAIRFRLSVVGWSGTANKPLHTSAVACEGVAADGFWDAFVLELRGAGEDDGLGVAEDVDGGLAVVGCFEAW